MKNIFAGRYLCVSRVVWYGTHGDPQASGPPPPGGMVWYPIRLDYGVVRIGKVLCRSISKHGAITMFQNH